MKLELPIPRGMWSELESRLSTAYDVDALTSAVSQAIDAVVNALALANYRVARRFVRAWSGLDDSLESSEVSHTAAHAALATVLSPFWDHESKRFRLSRQQFVETCLRTLGLVPSSE